MLKPKENYSLKNHNTFGIDVKAEKVYEISNIRQLQEISDWHNTFILGGGSNILLTGDLDKTVVINQIKGIKEIERKSDTILLEVSSGENWHELVLYAVEQNYGGIENLSLIPGSAGAAPMQNIGAYGVEIKEVLRYVKAFDLQKFKEIQFSNEDCEFAYRDSIFKKAAKGRYFITAIGIELSLKQHNIRTSYGAISELLESKGIQNPGIRDVSDAVIAIRRSKLPDPTLLGNAGSFFKNPIIEQEQFDRLKKQFPNISAYPLSNHEVKIPAGWLIESLGWKGKRIGNTGSHKDQALVLVNYGGASGTEIRDLSEAIKQSVRDRYQIELETEVNIIT